MPLTEELITEFNEAFKGVLSLGNDTKKGRISVYYGKGRGFDPEVICQTLFNSNHEDVSGFGGVYCLSLSQDKLDSRAPIFSKEKWRNQREEITSDAIKNLDRRIVSFMREQKDRIANPASSFTPVCLSVSAESGRSKDEIMTAIEEESQSIKADFDSASSFEEKVTCYKRMESFYEDIRKQDKLTSFVEEKFNSAPRLR